MKKRKASRSRKPRASARKPRASARRTAKKSVRRKSRTSAHRTTAPVQAVPPPRIRKAPPPNFSKKDLQNIREMLLAKRDEVLRSMRKSQEIETAPDVGDEADMAGQSIEKELQFELSDNERTTLDQIEGALRKIDKGTYGYCEHCRDPILKMRLKALPFARYCIRCQSTSERAVIL